MGLRQFFKSIGQKETVRDFRDRNFRGTQNGINKWTKEEVETFRNNLWQVIGWTEKLARDFDYEQGQYGLVFRQTNPELNGLKLYHFEGDEATWINDNYSMDNYDNLFQLAINERVEDNDCDLANINDLGRILCFQTCITTHDGASNESSCCFIDLSDVPPIDTWFYLKRDYYHSGARCDQTLFCWIPKAFESKMQDAIDVEMLDSYRWLDENDRDMYWRIKAPKP